MADWLVIDLEKCVWRSRSFVESSYCSIVPLSHRESKIALVCWQLMCGTWQAILWFSPPSSVIGIVEPWLIRGGLLVRFSLKAVSGFARETTWHRLIKQEKADSIERSRKCSKKFTMTRHLAERADRKHAEVDKASCCTEQLLIYERVDYHTACCSLVLRFYSISLNF